jgi:hypothetical protein
VDLKLSLFTLASLYSIKGVTHAQYPMGAGCNQYYYSQHDGEDATLKEV